VRGPNPVSVAIDIGDRVFCNVHAGAKVIAAFSSPEQVDTYLNNHLPEYTPKSVTDIAKLRDIYGKIRKQGYSIDDGEYDENVYAIAAPIFDHNNQAAAAVVIVAPYMRKKELKREHVIRLLKEVASLISGRLLGTKDYQEICNIHRATANN
jgi:DNA-binding IclR family transcriptional regulator